jgi:hypothetical protein
MIRTSNGGDCITIGSQMKPGGSANVRPQKPKPGRGGPGHGG